MGRTHTQGEMDWGVFAVVVNVHPGHLIQATCDRAKPIFYWTLLMFGKQFAAYRVVYSHIHSHPLIRRRKGNVQ